MIKLTRPDCPNKIALDAKNYKYPANKEALQKANFDKCMYCESKISHVYYGDVEHIKPKSKFPELEFEWENHGFICARCNGIKKDKFFEDSQFIDPYIEDPEEHILAIGVLIKHKRGSEKGEFTINEIELNRNELVERRKEKIDALEKAINSCFRTRNESLRNNALETLKKSADQANEYSLCVKYLLLAHKIL